ncbi:MAG: hypothetical protein ABIE03_05990 [Patescibacteria group bacterium]|nr:RTA1 domain-containing protein [Patescibacteria group bacterium]
MENQVDIGDQNIKQVGKSYVSQPIQTPAPEKARESYPLILTIIFGVPILSNILLQTVGYPLGYRLASVLVSDTSNAELDGFTTLLVTNIMLVVFFGVICGLLIYFLTKRIKFIFVGLGIFILIFAVYRIIIKISNEIYLTNEVNTALEGVDEVVGKEKLIFTYVDSVPVYDNKNILEEMEITFKVVAPKSGDYLIDSYLATPYDLYGPKDQEVSQADTFSKTTVSLTEGVPFDLIISLKMESFVDVNYEGNLNLSFRVWRTNIQVEDVAWHNEPISSWPVDIIDSGNSPNYKVSNDSGQEEPIYSVGPFYISRP